MNGGLGKAVASYAEGSVFDSRQKRQRFVLYKLCPRELSVKRRGVGHSALIEFIIYDAIVRR